MYNPWNEGKPVKIGRDGQEIQPRVGEELCRLFAEDHTVDITPILRKSKEAARYPKFNVTDWYLMFFVQQRTKGQRWVA